MMPFIRSDVQRVWMRASLDTTETYANAHANAPGMGKLKSKLNLER